MSTTDELVLKPLESSVLHHRRLANKTTVAMTTEELGPLNTLLGDITTNMTTSVKRPTYLPFPNDLSAYNKSNTMTNIIHSNKVKTIVVGYCGCQWSNTAS